MAADPITPPKPARPGAQPAGGKFSAWLRTHQKQALLGVGAAGAVGIALYRRHQAAAGATSSTTVPADATTASGSAGGIPGSYAPYDGSGAGGTFDSGTPTGSDAVDTINAIGGLLADLPAAPAGSPVKVTITNTVPKKPAKKKPAKKKPAKKPSPKRPAAKHPRSAPKPTAKPKKTKK